MKKKKTDKKTVLPFEIPVTRITPRSDASMYYTPGYERWLDARNRAIARDPDNWRMNY